MVRILPLVPPGVLCVLSLLLILTATSSLVAQATKRREAQPQQLLVLGVVVVAMIIWRSSTCSHNVVWAPNMKELAREGSVNAC